MLQAYREENPEMGEPPCEIRYPSFILLNNLTDMHHNMCYITFAYIGSMFNFVLPEGLKIAAVQHDPNGKEYESEKRKLKSDYCRIPSTSSTRQKRFSTSSLFLQSPLRGCLTSWKLSRSNNHSLKGRWWIDKNPILDVFWSFFSCTIVKKMWSLLHMLVECNKDIPLFMNLVILYYWFL